MPRLHFRTALWRKVASAVLAGSLALVPAASATADAGRERASARAHDFALPDINPRSASYGRTLTLSDLYAKRGLVLLFTASWCQICRAEMPDLERLHATGAAPLVFMAADEHGGPESILIVAERSGLTAPLLSVPPSRMEEFTKHYGYEILPAFYVIDRTGGIVDRHEGAVPAEQLARRAAKALGL